MLAISLMRMGAKGKPFYRLVVKEKRSKRDGAYLENVGTYNPMLDPAEVILNHERIQYWIGVGAQPTDTVRSLIKHNPVQTDEEKAAAEQARADKKAGEVAARVEATRIETERIETERAAADKATADEAAAKATEAAAALAEIDTPVAESEQANDPLKAPAHEGTEFPEASAAVEGTADSTEGGTAEAPAPEADDAEKKPVE
ncbi:MAG: 30S ribosomal protein S16 [Pyrinomonadaceae bacterium]